MSTFLAVLVVIIVVALIIEYIEYILAIIIAIAAIAGIAALVSAIKSNAKKKKELITNPKHYILETVHPSPLSASRGFMGCGHFKKANEFLISNLKAPIDWQITD